MAASAVTKFFKQYFVNAIFLVQSAMLQPRLYGCASDRMGGKRNCVAWSLVVVAVFLSSVTCQGELHF